jgi:aldose 1-epimerase
VPVGAAETAVTSAGHAASETLFQGYPAVVLAAADAGVEAVFAPRVGMIGCSLTHDGDELLHQLGGLSRYRATGPTMGVPLLHPWANRLGALSYSVAGRTVELGACVERLPTDPNGLPIHGVLSASPHWRLLALDADAHGARLSAQLDFGARPDYLEAFPFPHLVGIEAVLNGSELTIRTTVVASGESAVPLSFGYHPYLALPDVPRARWRVELPLTERLVLDERMIPTGAVERVEPFTGELGERTFDDGFAGARDGATFALSGGGRRIEVELVSGYGFAQVYAPASEDTICFEPMTAPTNALVSGRSLELVPPGESRTATFAIRVDRASPPA